MYIEVEVAIIHNFDSCMHFIIKLVPIHNLSNKLQQFKFSNSEVSLPLPQYMLITFMLFEIIIAMGVWMKYCDVKGKAR